MRRRNRGSGRRSICSTDGSAGRSPIIQTTESFAGGLPVVLGAQGVNEHIAAYMHYQREDLGVPTKTLEQDAYILREFFDWLASEGVVWTDATDAAIAKWLKPQHSLQSPRLERKCYVVFRFYLVLQTKGYLRSVAKLPYDLVGLGSAFPIQAVATESRRWGRRGARRGVDVKWWPALARPYSTAPRGPANRRVPTEEEVIGLLDQLLESSNSFTACRDWCCASYMAHVGLRTAGVAALSLIQLEKALLSAGIEIPVPSDGKEQEGAAKKGWTPRLSRLAALAHWADGQERLMEQVLSYGAYHDYLHVAVVEKGRKKRTVQVPVELFRVTLRTWIWDRRAEAVASRMQSHPGWLPSEHVWLSSRTLAPLLSASIGNLIKDAFRELAGEASIALSAHRLRAFYITHLIRRLYRKALAVQGRLLDPNSILQQAAELAGHEDPRSLKPYLDREVMAGLALQGHAVMVADEALADLLRGLTQRVEDGDDRLWDALNLAAKKFGVSPIPEISNSQDAVAALQRHEKAWKSRKVVKSSRKPN